MAKRTLQQIEEGLRARLAEQGSTEKTTPKYQSRLGQMLTPTPPPKSMQQEPGEAGKTIAGMLPGIGTAVDIADIAKGDYSSAPYMALGLIPGGKILKGPLKRVAKWFGKKGDDAADAVSTPVRTPKELERARKEAERDLEKARQETIKQREKEAAAKGKEVETGLVDPSGKPITRPLAKGETLPGETPTPAKPGWVRRAGKWAYEHPVGTLSALGLGAGATYTGIPQAWWRGAKQDPIGAITSPIDTTIQGKKQDVEDWLYKKDPNVTIDPSKYFPPEEPKTAPEQGKEPKKESRLQEKEETPVYTKDQYIGWAKKYADQYEIPLSMVLHAMFKETGWLGDPERMRVARSPTGARGVMQIQPEYAEKGAYKIKVKDLTDPEKNIEAGVRGLAYYYNKYKTPEKALAAYNAGEGGASKFLKTGDANTLRTSETRNYIKGFKDDVVHQLEKFYPKNKQKVAQVATDILATAVGAGNAQAADEVPVGIGGPDKKDRQPPTEAEIAQQKKERQKIADINRRLSRGEKFQDPVQGIEDIITNKLPQAQKDLERQTRDLEALKAEYERERAKLGSKTVPPDDPNSTYINVGPVRFKVDGKLKSPKFPSIQTDIPSGDYQSQGDATPAKTAIKKSSPVPKELPAVDDFGNVITPGKIDKKAEKPADKSRSQQSASGTIDRGSDAPKLGPQKSKSDSDLDKPAPGVSNKTIAPKSEPPAKAQAEPQADPNAAKGLAGSDKGEKKEKKTTNKVVAEPKADAPAADASAKEKINVRKEFERAFAAARAKQVLDTGKGSGGIFTFKNPVTGKEAQYTTDYADEVSKAKSPKKKEKVVGQDDAISQIIQGKKVVPSAVSDTDSNIEFDVITKTQKDKKSIDAKADVDAKVDARLSKELDQKLPPDYTVDIDPEALKVPAAPAPAVKSDVKTDKPANVLRSTSGTPVVSSTGEPWGTSTSTQRDIDNARTELKSVKPSFDVSDSDQETFGQKFKSSWDKFIDTVTHGRPPVQESINTEYNAELQDILKLAGRLK